MKQIKTAIKSGIFLKNYLEILKTKNEEIENKQNIINGINFRLNKGKLPATKLNW